MNDADKAAMILALQTNTALGRLATSEVRTAFEWLQANGYQVTKAPA